VNGGDTTAIPARRTSDVWTRYVPFDSLPQLLNPKGGYVRNENDPPYHTNLRQVLDRAKYPANFPDPALSLRSQHSLTLIDNNRKMSLEEITALKHSYRMLMADRVKTDLVAAVRDRYAANGAAAMVPADSAVLNALALIEKWDNAAAPESRGALLFETWARRMMQGRPTDSLWAQPWDPAAPLATPRGIRDRARAADAFIWAVGETARRFGSYDVAWGDVHRVRMGTVDVPVGGCAGALGCFRVLNFRTEPDGKRVASGGDGWVIAVEFTDVPKAYSVLAYGQSPREDSPYHSDQAAMFAKGEMKRVLFTDADIEKAVERRYRPGIK
jgi:acyl-homoserine-lactone acylase